MNKLNKKYFSVTETAKLVRVSLEEAFPDIRFTVRPSKHADSTSIHLCWTDGPTADQVEALTSVFIGAFFDSMTDQKRYVKALDKDGKEIQFGTDFIFYHREDSDFAVDAAIRKVCASHQLDQHRINLERFRLGELWSEFDANGRPVLGLVGRELDQNSYCTPLPSSTARSYRFFKSENHFWGTAA